MTQTQTYVEKLESHFHPAFLAMSVNTDSKKWHLVSYVKMLEQMCKDKEIEVKREPFPITNHFIYIKDQKGTEKCWTIEEETDTVYKIFHYDMITMIAKNRVHRDVDGKTRYDDYLYVPENVNRFSLDFITENFFNNLMEVGAEDD